MTTGQNELRMIWLISLIIVAAGAWYLDQLMLSLFCGLGLMISVMQYVSAVQTPLNTTAEALQAPIQRSSKVPLYISSIVAIIGGVTGLDGLMGVGITAWIFFLLRWLQRIEASMRILQQVLKHPSLHVQPESIPDHQQDVTTAQSSPSQHQSESLLDQIQNWAFKGNPVLKAAIVILVIGVILLLRFATENWQLSLAVKLGLVAIVSLLTVAGGFGLHRRNRSFALAIEGLGLAVLFLTLFFAYSNQVIATLGFASLLFTLIMATTVMLSLKQESVELVLIAVIVAYIAPFTLPNLKISTVELVTYYLFINIGIACLTTVRPWKVLNQIAFLMTAIFAGVHAFIYADQKDHVVLTILVLAHSAIFIWLGLRYSQLLSIHDFKQAKIKSLLDVGLIFAAPITAYAFLYLLHFNDVMWQADLSLFYALIFAVCWQWVARRSNLPVVAHSYFSLMLIFLALIPPILLHQEFSVMGWAIEGFIIYLWSLEKQQAIARNLAMGLLIMAGLTSMYYLVEMNPTPTHIFWVLSICYLLVVVLSQLKASYRQQLATSGVTFVCILSFLSSLTIALLLEDQWNLANNEVMSLGVITLVLAILNEMISRRTQSWTWQLPKWSGLLSLMLIAMAILFSHSTQAMILWDQPIEQLIFAFSSLLLVRLWLYLNSSIRLSNEIVSAGAFVSLTLASLCIVPALPYISMVILPLLFGLWCYKQPQDSNWQQLWQSKSTLALMLAWIVCSQLFSQQAFAYYLMPVFNPFDLVSLGMLTAFIWMLLQQAKVGRDKGLVAVMMVLSLLWLSSYIVLRALHMYVQTPFNSIEIWSNATIQLSLTILWVVLAFITMWSATWKKIQPMWILGGSILVVVTLKLVLLDLSHTGTLTRVISFLLAGGGMLLIAYIAPMPEVEKKA
ncbi:hypothetical protein A3K93_09785 [Acinetobacter sp. NCu2D-2]|uniref:DUF2339 domain-containing protein n=1 Tax=Acinetobacter sp. NCu2D-2 TaxID=1608473 RepID=UPI0007CE042B|nr:DUF2339 domain-containing protein [Acinetobacter sp. NCu2D-2]ANF82453.1 hypothetical protein A3K93_09785 [Acinetobacter sp. NCu2D-2]